MIITNISVFYSIAHEAYEAMEQNLTENITPNPNGKGSIIKYDPTRYSFKQALIASSFADSYIDVYIRILYFKKFNSPPLMKWDRQTNKEKLVTTFSVTDDTFLNDLELFRKHRNSIAHEKPLFPNHSNLDFFELTAQDCARLGIKIIENLQELLPL